MKKSLMLGVAAVVAIVVIATALTFFASKSTPQSPTHEELSAKLQEFQQLYNQKKASGCSMGEIDSLKQQAMAAYDKGDYSKARDLAEQAIEKLNGCQPTGSSLIEVTPTCGDGRCSGDETSPNCPQDCGASPHVVNSPSNGTLKWISIGPPGGDRFMLKIDPFNINRMVVVGHGGVHRTTDTADNWELIHNQEMTDSIVSVDFDKSKEGRIVIAGNPGAWETDDYLASTVSWKKITPGSTMAASAVYFNGKIYLSAGGKQTGLNAYEVLPDGTGYSQISEIPTSPIILFFKGALSIFAISSSNGPYKINANGKFLSIRGNLPDYALNGTYLAIDPSSDDTLYYGTYSSGVWKSIDGGTSWASVPIIKSDTRPLDDGTYPLVYSIGIDSINPKLILVGFNMFGGSLEQPLYHPTDKQTIGGGCYASLDGGKTWKRPGSASYYGCGFRTEFWPGETVATSYGTFSKYLYRTGGGMSNVNRIDLEKLLNGELAADIPNHGLNTVYINALREFEGTLFTAGEMGIAITDSSPSDIGARWVSKRSGKTVGYTWDFLKIPGDSGFYYAFGDPAWGKTESMGVLRYPDFTCDNVFGAAKGENCSPNEQILQGKGVWRLAYGPKDLSPSGSGSDKAIFALTQKDGVLRYDQATKSWDEVSKDSIDPTLRSVTSLLFASGQNPPLIGTRTVCSGTIGMDCSWYAVPDEQGAVYYFDSGSWKKAAGISYMVSDLVRDRYSAGILYAASSHGVYKSTDGGRTWSKAGSMSDLVRGVAIDRSGKVYAGTANGVYVSADGGSTWSLQNDGLFVTRVDRLIIVDGSNGNPDRVMVATNGGSVYSSYL